MGKILAICTSPKRGTVKTEVPSAVLTPEWGIVSDAHGGSWHRQVSLLSAEKIEAFRKKIWVDYGAFGENLVIEGFDFRNLPVTSRFAIGDVVLEMTQIGKECHNDCVIKQQTGECIMPREGVFARVLTGGEIHVGDEVTLLPPLENPPLRAAVITLSDKGSRGEREDKSGPLIVEMLTTAGYVVEETMILPDEAKALKAQLIRLADGRQVNLILTTGGTGFSPRDITPEATCAVADRNAPGIAEAMRYHSLSITPRGMLSRGVSVLRGKTLIVNLPGSPKAVQENLEYILPSLEHGVRIAAGLDGECARKYGFPPCFPLRGVEIECCFTKSKEKNRYERPSHFPPELSGCCRHRRCSRCPYCLRRRCFQHSRFRGILCRRFFTSSQERGADRVCRRIPHRDPHRHR